ncbi:flavin reductase family protein [Paracoccus sp. (in: a-proteobacteria)]|uniref:flavin reductase family protein n=1 Tax=Paracoccus sp. TaxID=267 RepID=UPI003A857BC2
MRFDLTPEDPQRSYKLLTATVTPRPIAWISSQSPDGVVNAAPYSFFNAMGHTPPTVAIGLIAHPEKGLKDSVRNILETGEFVVNLVSADLAQAMNQTCTDAPYGVSEIALAGLTTLPSAHIAPPRIAGAPVALECRRHTVVETGPGQNIVIGEVLAIHVADDCVLDADRAYIDTPGLNLIARLHGSGWYAKNPETFQMARPVYRAEQD